MYDHLEEICDSLVPDFGTAHVMTGANRAKIRAGLRCALDKGRARRNARKRKVTVAYLRCLDVAQSLDA